MRIELDPDGLRRAMAVRGLTQAELAAVAGVTEATVSHAMTGRRVDHTTVRKLARAMMLTPAMPGADSIVGSQREGAATEPPLLAAGAGALSNASAG